MSRSLGLVLIAAMLLAGCATMTRADGQTALCMRTWEQLKTGPMLTDLLIIPALPLMAVGFFPSASCPVEPPEHVFGPSDPCTRAGEVRVLAKPAHIWVCIPAADLEDRP